MNISSLTSQLSAVLESVFSLHFLYLGGMAAVLTQMKLPEKRYNTLLFFCLAAYFLLFYGQYLHIFTMAGDNICQIAYWKILFHPNLTGSIGASFTKPGQILILGPLYELSGIFGESIFRTGLCLIMAACVWSLIKVASDIGGKEAGLIAFFATTQVFLFEFIAGSFSIFLIPVLFAGLWLYFYRQEHKTLARLLLVLSIQFHILAIAVLGVVWITILLKKQWRELSLFSLHLIASIGIWALVLLRIQGSFERFQLGASAGYLPSQDYLIYASKTEFLIKTVWTELAASYSVQGLLFMAGIGIAGAFYYGYRYYLSIFATVALLLFNLALFGGGINLGRYFSPIYAFSCSVGIGTLVLAIKQLKIRTLFFRKYFVLAALFAVIIIFSMSAARSASFLTSDGTQPYVKSALYLLNDNKLPSSIALLAEDDLLYPIVLSSPDRYKKLTALQYFNSVQDQERKLILQQTDYIWIVLNGEHMYYYLNHLADATWSNDPFRLMVKSILQTKQYGSLYGFSFVPVDINAERLILKVERQNIN